MLKNIYEADTIITDSFHGCVFSILFNKPFYAFINKKKRG
ncbi:polysaccharide pyruvyl transferase family protein [Campylobacter ureolyticus]|nr:polysaccharide pyruvyl transferase family protein [Campylobacter ureolyticus]